MYKIDTLLKQNQRVFHTNDLALLWGITNRNTLYTTIKRYVARGILTTIHKGLYATVPLPQLDPYTLGIAVLHTYAYVSCETVLAGTGIIFQAGSAITLVSGLSRRFTVGDHSYVVRKMANRLLHHDAGIERRDGLLIASPPRAVADMLYFQNRAHFDVPDAVDWKAVRAIQKEVGYGRHA